MVQHLPAHSRWKFALIVCVALLLVFALCVSILVLFPNIFLNGFLKNKVTLVLQEKYPNHLVRIASVHASLLDNNVQFDSVTLIPTDTSFAFEVAHLSFNQIDWWQVVWDGDVRTHSLGNTVATAQNVSVTSGRYKYLCKGLRVSIPDSSFEMQHVSVAPNSDDETFFALKKTRSTRFKIDASQVDASGFDITGAMEGRQYSARSMLVDSLNIEIYVNKDKDYDRLAARPRMPNEILALVPVRLFVDSIAITNSQFKLAERYRRGARSATVAVVEIGMNIAGLSNISRSTTAMEIEAHGRMQQSGVMKAHISLPTKSVGLAMSISGSLSAMPLSKFNSFLQIADHTKITSGQLHSASMNISILNGRSTGKVKAVYTDLYITQLDEKTNEATGLMNSIKTFISNLFVFRSSNTRDSDGRIDLGTVNYVQKPNDEVMEIVWFSVRSGIGDVIGF